MSLSKRTQEISLAEAKAPEATLPPRPEADQKASYDVLYHAVSYVFNMADPVLGEASRPPYNDEV